MRINKKKMLKFKRNSLIGKVLLVAILLLIVLNIFRYAAYFKKEIDDKIGISIQNNVNLELAHDIFIDENEIIYLSEDDMKEYFDNELYYENNENNMRRYISVCQNKVLEITENEYHIFVNGVRQKIKGSVIEKEGIYYFPISELESVYNIEVDYLKDKNRLNIEKLSEEKVVAVVNKDTNLKYKMTNISKNIEKLTQGDKVTIVEKMDKSWYKVKTSDYAVGYIKSSKLLNEEMERYNLNKSDFSQIDLNNAVLINIDDSKYQNLDELIINYDNRKKEINKILKDVITEISKLEGKDVGVKVNLTNIQDTENYYRFLKELKAYINDVGVSLIIVNQDYLDNKILKDVVDVII